MIASAVGACGILVPEESIVQFVLSKEATIGRSVQRELKTCNSWMETMQDRPKLGRTEPASSAAITTAGTEGMLANNIGERVINVRAQVMMWDDRYCGWLPLEGGGVSTITLYQRVRNGSDSDAGAAAAAASAQQDQSAPTTSAPKFEYLIRGERIEDKTVTLYCQLRKDVNYRQVMPTFHHWQIEDRKFGLKFMSNYEACKFHNRLQKAIEHLYRQSKSSSGDSNLDTDDLEDDVFVPVELPLSRAESWESGVTGRAVAMSAPNVAAAGPSTGLLRTTFPSYSSTTVPTSTHQPVEIRKKKSAASTAAIPVQAPGDTTFGRPPGRTKTWPKGPTETTSTRGAAVPTTSAHTSGHFPYVYFQKEPSRATAYTKLSQPSRRPTSKVDLHQSASFGHLTPHPSRSVALGRSSALEKRGSVSSLKLSLVHQQLTLPTSTQSTGGSLFFGGGKKTTKSGLAGTSPLEILRRERCFYCKAYYAERDNRPGACPDAPDPFSKWIRRLTCLWCAECVLYCCCRHYSDGEAPRDADVCSCSPVDPMRRKRWTLLAFLALFVPCLFCYPPLTACHRCCRRRWRSFGGRHIPTAPTGSRQPTTSTAGRSSSVSRKSMTTEPSSTYK